MPAPDRDDTLAALEEAAHERIQRIVSGPRAPASRVVRLAGGVKVELHAFPRESRSAAFLAAPDRVAARLSVTGQPLLAEGRLAHVVLLPEIVLAESHLLTHLFLPEPGVLAQYMYPARWDRATSISGPRGTTDGHWRRAGLFESVLAQCSSAASGTLKFVTPRSALADSDIVAMESIEVRAHFAQNRATL